MIQARTAIVHDWFQGFHGSERTVEAMRGGLFPCENQPDIFTFHAARELLPEALARAIVKESRLSRLLGVRQQGHDPGRWRYLLPYMPTYFARLDLSAYDLVISSSHACAVNVHAPPGALHLCYCYTPMRYAWLAEMERGRAHGARRLVLDRLTRRLRRSDLAASRRPHGYAAISTAVRDRIRAFYGRDAAVIHPPVDVADLDPTKRKEPGRFLWVHRLVSYKRPEVVAEAFRGLPHRLTMVGVGPLGRRLRDTAPANVELRGWVSRAELARLYAEASGFIHIGEEDFGITMVEALASGTPVIALDRGGSADIVEHGRHGLLVDRPDVPAVREAVRQLGETSWDRATLTQRAAEFSRERFLQRLEGYIGELGRAGTT